MIITTIIARLRLRTNRSTIRYTARTCYYK